MTLYGSVALAQLALRGGPGSGRPVGHEQSYFGKGGGAGKTQSAIEAGLSKVGGGPTGIAMGMPDRTVEIDGQPTADDIASFADDNADLWDAEPDAHLVVVQVAGKTVLSAAKLFQTQEESP